MWCSYKKYSPTYCHNGHDWVWQLLLISKNEHIIKIINSNEMLSNHVTLCIFNLVLFISPGHTSATSTCICTRPKPQLSFSSHHLQEAVFLRQLSKSTNFLHFTETATLLLPSQSLVITVPSKINSVHTLPLLNIILQSMPGSSETSSSIQVF